MNDKLGTPRHQPFLNWKMLVVFCDDFPTSTSTILCIIWVNVCIHMGYVCIHMGYIYNIHIPMISPLIKPLFWGMIPPLPPVSREVGFTTQCQVDIPPCGRARVISPWQRTTIAGRQWDIYITSGNLTWLGKHGSCIWANYNNSQTWNKAIWDDSPY